ncbi:hypothetical protein [Gandjariella thermophila]|uniref:Uncharacterized protein n=1 Tax=Gandjariella thermophila TaxID=1931992 RepID=A0A4D4IZV4_9PSEU|nr:hypothetical protein [Gandjariella thermophila]GDY29781.1 hypothetical protein GTS_14140 [Gandjariella thermophila]
MGSAAALFVEMLRAGALSAGMRQRIEQAASGEAQPGHYRRGESPIEIW